MADSDKFCSYAFLPSLRADSALAINTGFVPKIGNYYSVEFHNFWGGIGMSIRYNGKLLVTGNFGIYMPC